MMQKIHELALPHPASPVASYVTVSIGVAFRAAGERLENADLVARADKALYQSKSSGRNRVRLYATEMEITSLP